MKKEELIALGLSEEQAQKVMGSLESYVEKAKFDEVSKENQTLKASVADRDKQLESLKKSSGDSAELKKQIEALQQQNAEQKKAHDAEMSQLRLDNAVDSALTAAGAKNIRAVRALIDLSKVKLGDDGKLSGWDDALKSVHDSDPYLFAESKTVFKGFEPGASGDATPDAGIDTSKMTYTELAAYMAANPDAKID